MKTEIGGCCYDKPAHVAFRPRDCFMGRMWERWYTGLEIHWVLETKLSEPSQWERGGQ